MQLLAYVVISFVCGVGYIFYIREKDTFEKEPISLMLYCTFVGGLLSIIFATVFYSFVDGPATTAGAFLVIAPVEELSKLMALAAVYARIRHDMNELVDGVVYMSCVALGFSTYEDVMYVVNAEAPLATLISRTILTIPGHIAFSAPMGMAFYQFKKKGIGYGLLPAFIVACCLHGLWNANVFGEWGLFMYIVLLTLVILRIVSRYGLLNSAFRPSLQSLAEKAARRERVAYCAGCDERFEERPQQTRFFRYTRCPRCELHIFHHRDLARLMRRLFPFSPPSKSQTKVHMLDLQERHRFRVDKNVEWISGDVRHLDDFVAELRDRKETDMLNTPIRVFLGCIGIRIDSQSRDGHIVNRIGEPEASHDERKL